MKLVLIPGMDGTGELFGPLLAALPDQDCLVLPLPATGPQDYATLVQKIHAELPTEPCVLMGESFAGPIAAQLSALPQVQAVIFVATFLSAPSRLLLSLARWLPISGMMRMPGANGVLRVLMLGREASGPFLKQFKTVVEQVDDQTLKNRMVAMQKLDPKLARVNKPAIYLQPAHDRLVPKSKAIAFKQHFPAIQIQAIAGPHFILQSKPNQAAALIEDFLHHVAQDDQ
ncbi:alpha/beta fold hydrolase [Marinicella meishanensis]|uniref:alpha/beta fold hydrolase n=1 Tax=Marinicella meishanensis TaxID=2873263 RepID=UPI001CC18342|nr:alpha/beta hydrolase [Marinicella sp. NBU2979]